MRDKNFVASLQKGLDTLTCFGRPQSRLTVSEVAKLPGNSPASARRSLTTLQQVGYLDGDGKHFWMLPRTLLVAHAYLSLRVWMSKIGVRRVAAVSFPFCRMKRSVITPVSQSPG